VFNCRILPPVQHTGRIMPALGGKVTRPRPHWFCAGLSTTIAGATLPGMREQIAVVLFLLSVPGFWPQTAPAGWKAIIDSKGLCQIAVPPDWVAGAENTGSAIFRDSTTGIAVVTSQPGQAFKPFTESFLKLMKIPKEKMFENTAKRIFYQDKASRNADDPTSFSASVPGRDGTCSCRVVFLLSVSEETAKKIALSLGPVPE